MVISDDRIRVFFHPGNLIELWQEACWRVQRSTRLHVEAEFRKTRRVHQGTLQAAETNPIGCYGELAVAKLLGRPWGNPGGTVPEGESGGDRGIDIVLADGTTIGVKTVRNPTAGLRIADIHRRDSAYFILCYKDPKLGTDPSGPMADFIDIIGWATRDEWDSGAVRKASRGWNWRELPHKKMNPMSDFFELHKIRPKLYRIGDGPFCLNA